MPKAPLQGVIVIGDVCLDVISVPRPPNPATCGGKENWRQTGERRAHYLPGGAMLLAEMIRAPEMADGQSPAVKDATKTAATEAKRQGMTKGDSRAFIGEAVETEKARARERVETAIPGPHAHGPVAGFPHGRPMRTDEFLGVAERLTRDEIVHSMVDVDMFPTDREARDSEKPAALRVRSERGFSGPAEGTNPKLRINYPDNPDP